MISALLAGCGSSGQVPSKEIKIAVLTYDEHDTFIESITKYMTIWARQKEKNEFQYTKFCILSS